ALAGDLVYRDQTAQLTHGDHAFQGVLAAFWERGPHQIGLFSTVRHQEKDKTSGSSFYSYTDTIDAVAIDLYGKFAAPIPGEDATVFGEAEAAYVLGSTNALRTPEQALEGSKTAIRSYGGAATLGVVHRAFSGGSAVEKERDSTKYLGTLDTRGVPYGDIVAQ